MKRITIGTRASKLAMIQTSEVVERLHQQWPTLDISIEQIRTQGDQITDVPLTQIGGDGVFVTEIEHALSERRIDLAVHSLKDLPTAQPQGLCLVVVGPREDVRDVLVWNNLAWQKNSQDWQENPDLEHTANMRIGTCSLRRTAQVRAIYPNAQILPLRGNVDTRLRKLNAGEYDGIVLAAAGLHRLGVHERLTGRTTYLPVEVMMPAPGQGALALEMRNEPEMHALVAPLNDLVTQAATTVERTFMRRLGAGCYLPVAAYGEVIAETLTLLGLVISLDGQHQVRVRRSMHWTPETSVDQAEQLGIQLAEQALAEGAAEIINAMDVEQIVREDMVSCPPGMAPARDDTTNSAGSQSSRQLVVAGLAPAMLTPLPIKGKHILVTRTREQASTLSERLRTFGAIPIEFPTIRIVPPHDWEPLDNALRKLCITGYYDWLIFTSANGVNMCFERLRHLGYDPSAFGDVQVAAIGPATAAALAQYGINADLVPGEYIADAVAAALIEDASRRKESLAGKRVLLARAAEARKVLVTELQRAGVLVDEVATYHTLPVTDDNEQGREILRMLQGHQIDIVTFTSSSTVRNFMQWLNDCEQNVTGSFTNVVTHDAHLKIACIGPITSQTARELGLDVHIEAREFTIDGLVKSIVQDEEKSWQNRQP